MAREGGEAPTEHNATVSGANVPEVREYVVNDFFVFALLKTFLPTYLNSSTCIPFPDGGWDG